MNTLAILLAIVAMIAILVVAWLLYMGFFQTIHVEVREVPEMTVLNMNYTGSMKDMMKGVVDADRRIKELLPNAPLFPRVGSFYYTNPSNVPNPEDNKWSVFYVLDDVPAMMKAAKDLPTSNDYSVVTIPKSKIMYSTFVHRNNLSFMLGPSKVYPAFTAFLQKNALVPVGSAEIYHANMDPIEYVMYLDNKEPFVSLEKTSFVKANLL
ncbi:hypothetical protein WA538_000510 [Blastocystis sp. DL]